MTFRHSICNEAFEKWPFADACRAIRKIGYTGIEIAPFTLAEKPSEVTAAARKEYVRIMQDEGLTFVGLHWLMMSPPGLHVTTPDAELRRRGWQHIRDLIDLCADLGPERGGGGKSVMVFGSPKQRCTTGGLSRAEATRHMADGLASAAPHAVERGVTILLEALPLNQCDVVQTLEEAAGIVEEIDGRHGEFIDRERIVGRDGWREEPVSLEPVGHDGPREKNAADGGGRGTDAAKHKWFHD